MLIGMWLFSNFSTHKLICLCKAKIEQLLFFFNQTAFIEFGNFWEIYLINFSEAGEFFRLRRLLSKLMETLHYAIICSVYIYSSFRKLFISENRRKKKTTTTTLIYRSFGIMGFDRSMGNAWNQNNVIMWHLFTVGTALLCQGNRAG